MSYNWNIVNQIQKYIHDYDPWTEWRGSEGWHFTILKQIDFILKIYNSESFLGHNLQF